MPNAQQSSDLPSIRTMTSAKMKNELSLPQRTKLSNAELQVKVRQHRAQAVDEQFALTSTARRTATALKRSKREEPDTSHQPKRQAVQSSAEEPPEEVSFRQLQAQATKLGLKANLSRRRLIELIATAPADTEGTTDETTRGPVGANVDQGEAAHPNNDEIFVAWQPSDAEASRINDAVQLLSKRHC